MISNTLTFDLADNPDLYKALSEQFAESDEVTVTVRITKQELTNERLVSPVISLVPDGYKETDGEDYQEESPGDRPAIALVLDAKED